MIKSLAISATVIAFSAISIAQIPITTINTPPGSGPTAPQPQLIPCVPAVPTLPGTTWAFSDVGGLIAEAGSFTILPGLRGTEMQITGTLTANTAGTVLERLGTFGGSIDTSCLAGTTTVAAGTLQIADGITGQIFTWSYPITATFSGRNVTYAVTSTTTMFLSRYGAFDPDGPPPANLNGTNGYNYMGNPNFAATGSATEIVGAVPCPANPNSVLDSFAPHGFNAGPGTLLTFTAGTGPTGSVTGNLALNSASNPQPTEAGSYQVYPNCTGFSMNFPVLQGGRIVGANFEGVFAAGDFSRAIIIGNIPGPSFTLIRNP